MRIVSPRQPRHPSPTTSAGKAMKYCPSPSKRWKGVQKGRDHDAWVDVSEGGNISGDRKVDVSPQQEADLSPSKKCQRILLTINRWYLKARRPDKVHHPLRRNVNALDSLEQRAVSPDIPSHMTALATSSALALIDQNHVRKRTASDGTAKSYSLVRIWEVRRIRSPVCRVSWPHPTLQQIIHSRHPLREGHRQYNKASRGTLCCYYRSNCSSPPMAEQSIEPSLRVQTLLRESRQQPMHI